MPARTSTPRPPRSFRRRVLRYLLLAFVVSSVALVVAGLLFLREIRRDLPPVEQIASYRPALVSEVYAADGTRIGEFYIEKRYLVPLEEIPVRVRQAFIAAEDSRFYEHQGVDFGGIVRAAWHNFVAGGVVQGGSTITQQVVKALLLTPERSYRRKIREILLSLRLERQFEKDEILYLYLNQIYLGSGAYGVGAAAQVYFDKEVGELTLAEAALLAGLPQAPSRTSPIRHPKRARARQLYVLTRMEAEGFVTREEREAAAAAPIELARQKPGSSYTQAPDYVELVRRVLEDRYGTQAAYELGLRIDTAVDTKMQAAAEAALRDGLRALDRRRGYRGPMRSAGEDEAPALLARQDKDLGQRGGPKAGDRLEALVVGSSADRASLRIGGWQATLPASEMKWARGWTPAKFRPGDVLRVLVEEAPKDGPLRVSLDQDPDVEGAVLAMEASNGLVRAMVGGYDFGRSQFNRAVQAVRQPGSAFKPFVYAAAFDRGYTPASVVIDSPITFEDGSNKLWKPENYDTEFHGATRLREALVRSMNVVTVKVAQDIGLPYLTSYLSRFGFQRPFPQNLSLALGTAEVTLLEMVRAYDVFATGGKLVEPIFITKITDSAGNVLEQREPSSKPVLDPETAYLVTNLMKGVIERGTGRRAAALNRPAAGKTGTTNDQMDAWFMGFTPELVAGAWVGFDEQKTLGKQETGGRAAVPIWLDFMKAATEGRPIRDFDIPKGVVFANIDAETGLRAAPGDPTMLLECFRRGTEPQEVAQAASEGPAPEDFFRGEF